MTTTSKGVLVFGATGNMGGAAARELLKRGWRVRAVTRDPQSEKAQALAALGAELVQADMDDPASLEAAFDGVTRVFSVQNWSISGVEGEIRQGKHVADAAKTAGVTHLVFGSAGVGQPDTGVPHFDCKVVVERYMRDELGLPVTVIRPGPFMELMTDKAFFPPLAAWGMMPKIVGWETPLPWTAVADIGAAIANVFENPTKWIGRDIDLIGDVASMRQCQQAFKAITGKKPFGIGLPVALFNKMAGPEMVTMWRWLADYLAANDINAAKGEMLAAAREACPQLHSVTDWLKSERNGQGL
ncbi:NmrA/HSCARG family protein [Litorilinea aerophila]|uniref:NmrA/HSCARG family protein n=1 Tax=Litorilinea aerophila TaxID=1204385 RepID=A0A540VCF8_9CHLR|nr:NmrA/HSCARG family protein [Litorilinea aerophila]MCC9077838.1 NmrA/HSCARG family protein [Litorilinea aerophila]